MDGLRVIVTAAGALWMLASAVVVPPGLAVNLSSSDYEESFAAEVYLCVVDSQDDWATDLRAIWGKDEQSICLPHACADGVDPAKAGVACLSTKA